MSRPAVARRTPAHPRGGALPRGPRRVSGPIARPVPVVETGIGARVRALPDSSFLDTLLRSRAWIWLIGLSLGGIVAMQVSLLKLNNGIGRAVESAGTLERQNAALEAEIARLTSGERIRAGAASQGMVLPEAGSVGYLAIRPGDARRAAIRMQPPSDEARALMERGGLPEAATLAPVATDTAAVATPGTDATVLPGPTPTPTPAPTDLPPAATGGAAAAEG